MIDFKPFLRKLHKNLQILQEREARYADNAPPELINQIDDHQTAISLTEQAMRGDISQAEWREHLKPRLMEIIRAAKEENADILIWIVDLIIQCTVQFYI